MPEPAPTLTADRRPTGTDGRRRRRDRNRVAVVDALLDLYREGNLRPSTAEVADRAGLSPRSLFRYFDDVDDLYRAAIDRYGRRAVGLAVLDLDPARPLPARVQALVAQRLRLFEAIEPVATVSRLQAPFQPQIGAELHRRRGLLRGQVADLFAPELRAMDEARALSTLAAADVVTSFESYQLLRHEHGLSPARIQAVLAEALLRLLGGASG